MEFLLSQFKEDGVLTCMICLETVDDAHICPFCSKIYCHHCIDEWLAAKNKCPNCLRTILASQVIKCRWMSEITDLLSKIRLELSEIEKDKGDGDGVLRVCSSHYEGKITALREELEEVMQERDLLLIEKDTVQDERKELQKQIEKNNQIEEILAVERNIFEDEKNLFQQNQRNGSVKIVDLTEDDESPFIDVTTTDDVRVSTKILIPDANMVGRIIGTGGRTIKHLEQVTQCNMRVRGKGLRDADQEETQPLHVEVWCQAKPEDAYSRMSGAIKHVRTVIERFVEEEPPTIYIGAMFEF